MNLCSLSYVGLIGVLLSSSSYAADNLTYFADREKERALKPRVELNHRYSNDRAITMSEFWVPLAQEENSVWFGDLRLMGDNNTNKEFNIGTGYRKIVGDAVIGGMAWFDRRLTERGSEFNQVALGLEYLGKQFDVRANGYIPLNDKKIHTQSNPDGSGLGFVNNQLLVNTDQIVTEEALSGIDVEIGSRVNILDQFTDSTRIYLGGYHFEGNRTDNVNGVRARIASDITSDIQLGARLQHDDVRDTQAYAEATIRFPFKAKKSFEEEGLRSRLDESPERDIDIVSNEAIVDEGLSNTPLLNAQTGLVQNIIHVDNTNGAGTGTAENPFNTLLAAEAAAGANDLIYVHRGDGTATGQDAGITLDDVGQMLVGSGTNLTFDFDRFDTANGLSVSQIILPKTQSPVITNLAGNGVDITADNVYLSGVTVNGVSNRGVFALNNSGVTWNSIDIDNVIVTDSGAAGIEIRPRNENSDIKNTTIKNVQVFNSAGTGIITRALSGGDFENILIENAFVSNSSSRGIDIRAFDNTSINTVRLKNIISSNNDLNGIITPTNGNGVIHLLIANNIVSSNNGGHGIRIGVNDESSIKKAFYSNVVSNSNTASGISVPVGGNGAIDFFLENSALIDNGEYGLLFENVSGNGTLIFNPNENEIIGNSLGGVEVIN